METFQLERTIPFGSKSQFPAKVRAKSKEEIGYNGYGVLKAQKLLPELRTP
jgi:hypothetical protein